MKILNVETIRNTEEQNVENGEFSWKELMEYAAFQFCTFFAKKHRTKKFENVFVIAGNGNNGGDAFLVSNFIDKLIPIKVNLLILDISSKRSELNKWALKKNLINSNINIYSIENEYSIPDIKDRDVIIDGVFGIGLNRPVTGNLRSIFQSINCIPCMKYAIDIPSGMYGDTLNPSESCILDCDETLTFHAPKPSFFLDENLEILSNLEIVDIGLKDLVYEGILSDEYVTAEHFLVKFKSRNNISYKGNFGNVAIVGGSQGMYGAPIISSKAALSAGCGYSSLVSCSEVLDGLAAPSILTLTTNDGSNISKIPTNSNYTYGIGPGLGRSNEAESALHDFLERIESPIVIDADALSLIGEKSLLHLIPPKSILTPHIGEFRKLTKQSWSNGQEKLDMLRSFSQENKCITVLKGPHTSICDEHGRIYFNSTGNPSLAVAGSGDVLTGIITAFLAQGYDSLEAAVKGVYLHGLAADLYVRDKSEYSLTPESLIEYIGMALKYA